jgi:C4-dicarboxylate transporter, DctM subunit
MVDWLQALLFGIGTLLIFSAIGLPIAFSLMLSSFIGLSIFRSPQVAVGSLKSAIFGGPSDISLLPIPLFVLMASLLIGSGLSVRAYDAFTRLFSGFKAGLPVATNALLAFFGALMGSSAAAIGMVTQMGAPELKARGYSNSLIAGIIAGGSGLAVILPPSILIILYSFVMQQGVIPLFAAGIIPGLLIAFGYMVWVIVYTWWKPPHTAAAAPHAVTAPDAASASDAPPAAPARRRRSVLLTASPAWARLPPYDARFSDEARAALAGNITLFGRVKALFELVPMFAVLLVTLGSMFLGYASITEGAAVGVFGVLVVALLYRTLTWRGVFWSLWNTVLVAGFIMLLIVGGRYFGSLFNLTGVTWQFAQWFTGLPFDGILLLLATMVIFLLVGCIMEPITIMLVLVPIAATPLIQLGFDPFLLGILFVVNVEMALTTPPIGINLFVMAGMARPYGIRFGDIVRGVIPFLIVDAIVIVLMVYNPWMATWLANLAR